MSRQILNDGEGGLSFRNKLNANFLELYNIASVFVATHRTTPAPFTIDTTPTTIPFSDTVDYTNQVAYDPLTGIFTNTYAGWYDINFYFTGNWGNGDEIIFELWVGGAKYGAEITLTGAGATKNIPLGIPSFVALGANDTLEIKAYMATGSTSLNIVGGSVVLDLKITT